MIEAVIWDIDGTLVDSEPLHQEALLAICDRYHVDISDLANDHFVGVNLLGVWAELGQRFPSKLSYDGWVNELTSVYAARADHLRPIPGARNAIRTLAINGFRQAAVSNSNRVIVDTNLAVLGICDLLDFSLSLDDVNAGKPSPEPYLNAMERLGLKPAQAIAVEDSNTGVQSAKAAGLTVFGFGSGNVALGADLHISSLNNFMNYLEVIGMKNPAHAAT